MPDLPLVSIVTPTYNRRRFIPSLIKMVQTQTYPRDRMEWIVFDDGQEEVEEAVKALQENPGYRLAGSSEVYMYFTDTKEIWKAGPYFKGHATNGTMAWTKSYADTHQYDETVAFSEEKSFLEGYKNPLVQLNPKTVMLVMSHSDNTFDKTELRTNTNPLLVRTNLKMKDFIKDPELFNFFSTLSIHFI